MSCSFFRRNISLNEETERTPAMLVPQAVFGLLTALQPLSFPGRSESPCRAAATFPASTTR